MGRGESMAGMADRIVEARKAMKRAVLEAWGKLRDDMEKPEVWAKAMRAFNPNMFIAPERAGVYREDMLAQVDRFVRSLE
jgi:hypothetical protein